MVCPVFVRPPVSFVSETISHIFIDIYTLTIVRYGKIEPVISDYPLDQVEAVLAYRKEQKRLEKLAKREARKKKAAEKKGKADICI